ncbi:MULTISPECIES: winged helix-turn-helix domain-containing protein [Terrisporobacter]|uniref:winged helix-turn-helix domain-containing protein n=1 Tax=Terrisporobacter TaxID=1505652 RepID=UPI0009A94425|nr:helix-turn-helix domain-containing protein [Terrisporobacter othiniensis]MDY3374833.1 helix-turn-helix domain-containing protein [Terrisporobacter othiniensis]
MALTNHEFDILCLLLKNPDKVYSREALYEQVWKSGYYGEDNSVNVHVSNIRKKIKDIAEDEEYIKTVLGIGFKLNND